MKTLRTATLTALLASGTMLSAQFSPLPPLHDETPGSVSGFYQQLLVDEGLSPFTNQPTDWTDGWAGQPPSLTAGVDFNPSDIMRVFFVGKHAAWINNLGIHEGTVTEQYGTGGNVFDSGQNFTLFDASVSAGYTVSIPLDGMTSFDFWLSTQVPDNREGEFGTDRGGIWSLFNPEFNNPDTDPFIQGRGTSILYNGRTIHLFAFEDINRNHPTSDDDFDDFVFMVEFIPIPEPSTYGMFGVLGLLGIISIRRLMAAKR